MRGDGPLSSKSRQDTAHAQNCGNPALVIY